MLIIIWLLLIMLGLVASKSKLVSILDLLFFVVASGFRTQGVDWIVYVAEYRWAPLQTSADVKYPGFLIFEHFAYDHGLDFEHFIIFNAIVCGTLLFLAFYQISENPNALFSMYLLYPFGHEVVQMKSFLADVIIYVSIPLILKIRPETKKWKKIVRIGCYFVLNYIALQCQFSVAFYLIATAIYLFGSEKFKKNYYIPFVFIITTIVYSGIFNSLLQSLNSRAKDYIAINTRFGMLIPIALSIMIWWLGDKVIYLSESVGLTEIKKIPLENYKKYIECILLLIPLLCYDITFNRLWRLFLVLIYAVFAKFLHLKAIDRNTKGFVGIIFIVIILLIIICENEFSIIFGFLTNNKLLG